MLVCSTRRGVSENTSGLVYVREVQMNFDYKSDNGYYDQTESNIVNQSDLDAHELGDSAAEGEQ